MCVATYPTPVWRTLVMYEMGVMVSISLSGNLPLPAGERDDRPAEPLYSYSGSGFEVEFDLPTRGAEAASGSPAG